MKNYFFTSESVSEGHPDKMADQISDAILDALLKQDPQSRVACETMISTDFIALAGEITTQAKVDFAEVARQVVRDIGYDDKGKGFDHKSCDIFTAMDPQSSDIAMGVNDDKHEQGAGDQGIMFGYAIRETPELMPLTISLSHQLVYNLMKIRKNKDHEMSCFLLPDSKSQVTVEYLEGQAHRIDTIVLSTQHSADISMKSLKAFILEELIPLTIPSHWIDNKTKFFVNPTGRFVIGGPHGDCGLTGRKIIVDTYGGHGAHGGGAFSGKDPSKVDRSASYVARHIAKNIVGAGLADKCLVQLSYAIGVAAPTSLMVNDFGTGKVSSEVLTQAVHEVWDLRPAAIVESFDLLQPHYRKTAAYGHFGRESEEFTWEKLDRVDKLNDVVKTLGTLRAWVT